MRYAVAGALLALLPASLQAATGIVPAGAEVIFATPDGRGDPNAWVCRKPMALGGPGFHARRFGPEVCQTNQFWANLLKHHETVDAKGAVVPIASAGIGSWGNVGEDTNFAASRDGNAYFDAHR